MSADTLSSVSRKARKVHRCVWCGEAISIGEQYQHDSVAYDGTVQDNKYHLDCYEDSIDYFKATGDTEFSEGMTDRKEVRERLAAKREAFPVSGGSER